MAAPTISLNLKNLRRRIARRFDDNENGTATGGSAAGGTNSGGTLTAGGTLLRFPSSPSALLDAELTHINSTETTQTNFVQSHSVSGTTATLEVFGSWTAPINNNTYEVHKLSNSGFRKAEYEDAINAAIDYAADGYFTDTDSINFGMQTGGEDQLASYPRREYPIPGSLNYLTKVFYLNASPTASNSLTTIDSWEDFGKATGSTRLAQGFKVQRTGFYEFFAVGMRKVGSPTDNLVLTVRTNSSGVASGTVVTDGTSDDYDGSKLEDRASWVIFRLSPPPLLVDGTQYHWSVTRDGSTSNTNYYQLAEDEDGGYGDGSAQTYDGSYAAISGSDFCFAIFPASSNWIELAPKKGWAYRRVGSDVLYIPGSFTDGTPIRILGGTAIAEVTTETATVPIRPEWVEAFAVDYLLGSKTASNYGPNYGAGARLWAERILKQPRPMRGIPSNAVLVRA